MDPSDIKMKTGFNLSEQEYDSEQQKFIAKTMGLLQVFSEDALHTAAQYVVGNGRSTVTDDDILKGLKFQARMFFQRVDDLEGRVEEAISELYNTMSDESESETNTSDEDNVSDNDESDDTDSDEDMEIDENEVTECKRIVPQVDAIVSSWNKYSPDDPVLVFIKKAIDEAESNA